MHTRKYRHQGRIINHTQDIAEKHGVNRFVTLSFVSSKSSTPLWVSDLALVNRLVQIYIKEINRRLNGRPRKRSKKKPPPIPAIAIPEYKSEMGGPTALHFHCMIRVPDESLDYFSRVTKDFWARIVKNTIAHPPRIDDRQIYDARGVARYILKNIEDGITLENAILSGIA